MGVGVVDYVLRFVKCSDIHRQKEDSFACYLLHAPCFFSGGCELFLKDFLFAGSFFFTQSCYMAKFQSFWCWKVYREWLNGISLLANNLAC